MWRGGQGQSSWFGGGAPEKDLERAAQRISSRLFEAGDLNHDGSISLDEFRASIGPRLFESVNGKLSLLPLWAPTSGPGERSFATVLAELRAAREREAARQRCVAPVAWHHWLCPFQHLLFQ